jgi:photosystem II stability/assembly factor-like uncharacterized protein
MKGIITSSLLVFFLFFLLSLYDNPLDKNIEKNQVKTHFPFEEYYMSRNYPDFNLDINAIEESKQEIQNAIAARSSNPFDSAWQSIGPGNIGGRFNCLANDPMNDSIIYAGSPCGGIFKTRNSGQSWEPIFDNEAYLSIGHIAINPKNSNVVYAGTGDVNISGSAFIGNGIYKSTNAGGTWTHLGLTQESIISKIRVNPIDTNIIYVAAMGLPFEKHNHRGLYKSIDGGQSFNQILFINDSTGIIDLVLNPKDPNIIYASSWNRIRNNQKSLVSGPDGKIHKSIDGGTTWTELTNGLPSGNLSRIGIDIVPGQPDTLFSVFVGDDQAIKGVFATYDAGSQWHDITTDIDTTMLRNFGWYFGKIRVNPYKPNEIYVLGVDMFRTTDGGASWHMCTPVWHQYDVHADKHDLIFFGPDDMLLATDGGLYSSIDNTNNWTDPENMPITQFYHVTYNPHSINDYWGGAQDNGTMSGNIFNLNNWAREFGGDGFKTVFHPEDENIVYVETQRGYVRELYTYTDITESNNGIDHSTERINWYMPYILSHHDYDRMYLGTHRVFKNTTGVNAYWTPISPDLTDGDIYGAKFHNISNVAESPLDENILYAGTSDGNVWTSLDEGLSWNNTSSGLPKRYVTGIYPSHNDTLRAFLCVSGFKYNDPYPHIFRTDDAGQSWVDISGDLPQMPINDVLAHPNNDSILFVATDGGIYGSLNAGINWHRVGTNMPIYTVFDIAYHSEFNQIIAGTHARSMHLYDLNEIGLPDASQINEYDYNTIKVFPTISSRRININHPFSELHLTIYDLSGKKCDETIIKEKDASLNISSLKKGSYIIKSRYKNKIYTNRIVKE